MKICEVLKEEEANYTVDSMFMKLCLGLISREEFIGGMIFANSCGLITDMEFCFLSNASWNIMI